MISIVVFVGGGETDLVATTIESLKQQLFGRWEMVLVCEKDVARTITSTLDGSPEADQQVIQIVSVEELHQDLLAKGVSASAGEFVWFVRNGDRLASHALAAVAESLARTPDTDLLYCDEDQISESGESLVPFFKPGWSPELLLSMNYISYAALFRRVLLSDILIAHKEPGHCSPYDYVLPVAEKTKKIVHIPDVLYHSREGSEGGGDEAVSGTRPGQVERAALERALRRRNIAGLVEEAGPGRFRIRYRLAGSPLVSIIIPTKDRAALLERCLRSIEQRTAYSAYEIIILDNGSVSNEMKECLDEAAKRWRVLGCPGPFNFSSLNNRGAEAAGGEYLLFLNDDTEVIADEWLTVMLEQVTRPGVGAVGAKLLYPDGAIQHGGVVLGVRGLACHAFRHTPDAAWGYHGLAHVTRNCSAVTAACMLVPHPVFDEVGGFDLRFPVEYNDVDLCLRIREKRYRIVYAADAKLYHYESATRRGTRAWTDELHAVQVWGDVIRRGDPYYHPNLTRS